MANFRLPSFLSSPYQLLILFIAASALYYITFDSIWSLPILLTHKQTVSSIIINLVVLFMLCSLFWWLVVVGMRFLLKKVLTYTRWIFENPKSLSWKTRLWGVCMSVFLKAKDRKLYDFQDILPNLPLPKLDVTISKYLKSIKPLFSEELYNKHQILARDFLQNEGVELQKELVKRHKTTDNYVSQFWEDYAYLAGGRRSKNPTEDTSPNPGIMINTSVSLLCAFGTPIDYRQASRAASLAHLQLHYRYLLQNEKLQPFHLQGVPLCSQQYRRLYNLARTPGRGGFDHLVFSPGKETSFIVVYNEGRYYKIDAYQNGKLVSPKQLEKTFLSILADNSAVTEAEQKLPAFTAGDREEWAEFRENHLSTGQNKENLSIIETCAFFVVFDPDERFLGKLPDFVNPDKVPYPKTGTDHPSEYAASILHGSGSNRWMDKSINLVVFKTGLFGYSVEHSTSDAPPYVQIVECVLAIDMDYFVGGNSRSKVPIWIDRNLIDWEKPRYNAKGFINDDSDPKPAVCTKLEWKFSEEVEKKIIYQAAVTLGYAQSVQLKLALFDRFGKTRMKQLKMSPDAFVQMAIQLAYYKDQNEFALTYESGLTRLFKFGRTETIRSVTEESCVFVRSMVEDKIDVYKAYKLLQAAGKVHSLSSKQALVGQGIDRHLFALYVTSTLKGIHSEFLENAMNIPFKISTSQVPTNQMALDLKTRSDMLILGGGFGPVTKHGYGITYFFQYDKAISIHVSAFNESPRTDAVRLYDRLVESLVQLETVCSHAMQLTGDERFEGENRFISYNDSIAN